MNAESNSENLFERNYRSVAAGIVAVLLLSGCATHLTSYAPTENQTVTYEQGVGAISWEADGVVLTMYPTFSYQSPSDIPTFTLVIQNRTSRDIDFVPENIHAYLDDHDCHLYTMQERIGEIRSSAKRKQIALAVLGGVAAGAAAYVGSHQTVSYSSYSQIGRHQYWSSGTIRVYDPASGIFAGAAMGAATGVGIHQIASAAGYEEQAAQAIFQHSTVHAGATLVGQVMLKVPFGRFNAVRMEVPVDLSQSTFTFARRTTSS